MKTKTSEMPWWDVTLLHVSLREQLLKTKGSYMDLYKTYDIFYADTYISKWGKLPYSIHGNKERKKLQLCCFVVVVFFK